MKLLTKKMFTNRNRFTRQCIGEAILMLTQQKGFESVTISDIVKKAGVSRMTFYHYFCSKTDAVNNYLQEIINGYLEECPENLTSAALCEEERIRHALCYFDRYAFFFKTLEEENLYYLMINAINEYMILYAAPNYSGSVYDLYYYAGALLNVFLQWEKGEKQEPVDEIVQILASLAKNN
ncbi:MAG: TetR/AcrR family transcriptional regulator [Lachnospiraceae bacterium]|nr:TetR/AcrR family transcriptional regulator [Lachnospiraceae bacterium]